MRGFIFLCVAYLTVPLVAGACLLIDGFASHSAVQILNVSYDPTRELWRDLNRGFQAKYEAEAGHRIRIRQSHGGSTSQARAVIDGLSADVVSLAFWTDADEIRKAGLIANDWEQRLPNNATAYYSTVVFVVRRGNPKHIHDWPDLLRTGVEVITPNPKTSGNGKLSFLAAWGAVTARGGSEDEARSFVAKLYRQVPVMDTGARGSTTTFAQNGLGDVHLTWENEAHQEVRETRGLVEIIYPPISIRAEPPIALVDQNVDARGTREHAEAYLKYLYSDEAQDIIACNYFRPINGLIEQRHRDQFPSIELFRITRIAASWRAAQDRFFESGGVFDQIYLK